MTDGKHNVLEMMNNLGISTTLSCVLSAVKLKANGKDDPKWIALIKCAENLWDASIALPEA